MQSRFQSSEPATVTDKLTPDERKVVQLVCAGHLRPPLTPPVVSADDWPRLVSVALRHKLAPLLCTSVKTLGLRDSLPANAMEPLTTAYLETTLANMQAYSDLGELQTAFQARAIPAVALKGAALASTLYDDIGLRPFTDLDILIRPKDLECASDGLFRLGYTSQVVRNANFQARFNFEQHFDRVDQSSTFVDLHWHLVSSVYHREKIQPDWFWDRTCAQSMGGVQALVLNPNATFLHLCMHLVFHHASRILLRTYDLALWILRDGSHADWDEIVSAAVAFKLVPAVRSACLAVYQDWGIGLPAEIADRLQTVRVSAVERAVFRIVSSPDQRLVPLVNLAFQPGIDSKLSYCRAMLFPSEAFLRTTMPANAQGSRFSMVLRRMLRTPRRWLRAARQVTSRE